MKVAIIISLLLTLAGTSVLALDKAELDARIRRITAKLESMQEKGADKRIPAETLQKARGIILLDRTKAGFIFAYQGGSGVGMVRDAKSGVWSPVAFYEANEASLGFQIGGQKTFMVILLMNNETTRLLTEPNTNFGGEASGTAGDSKAVAEGNVAPTTPGVLVYDERQGLYGGAAIKGGAISPDNEANLKYYGEPLTVKEILFDHKAKATPAATELAGKINTLAKGSK